jgi:hypothetical protein
MTMNREKTYFYENSDEDTPADRPARPPPHCSPGRGSHAAATSGCIRCRRICSGMHFRPCSRASRPPAHIPECTLHWPFHQNRLSLTFLGRLQKLQEYNKFYKLTINTSPACVQTRFVFLLFFSEATMNITRGDQL